ncbi:MAG: fructose-1,6-bisphosphatase [Bacillariaceae sp.]|jgi:fructose-1,6-bisphosphatase
MSFLTISKAADNDLPFINKRRIVISNNKKQKVKDTVIDGQHQQQLKETSS